MEELHRWLETQFAQKKAEPTSRLLFYKTLNGAQAGDLIMTLIHSCELCGANAFDYLTELQHHAIELASRPAQWMHRNYRETVLETDASGNSG
jgi:hypothetical protein